MTDDEIRSRVTRALATATNRPHTTTVLINPEQRTIHVRVDVMTSKGEYHWSANTNWDLNAEGQIRIFVIGREEFEACPYAYLADFLYSFGRAIALIPD